ncbi:MAG: RecX family transcriptional regulator [Prevotella ruminicola]|jgi:regulatory protein|uniref:Regulatory protein RecX n=1 Tax=Xylanibacter ruminicola TaxID=839 RepID=A0A9D5S8H4_XYLRU|nr:RecX family transcriptional regulator [Xylanibacter ruminicola]
MTKEKTEQEAYLQLAAVCAQAEHCEQEMRDKMKRWGMDVEAQNRVIERLAQERYIDNERYARAFVKDKVRYNKWGRRKVQQALWMKRIDDDIQQRVLDEIDDAEYLKVLMPLLKQKRKSIKAANDYELNQKLVRFALSRGFDYGVIRQCLDVDEEMDFSDEMD